MTPDEIDALGLEWAGPRCYLCEQPIFAGQVAAEVDVTLDDDSIERADVHRACLEDTDIPVVDGLTH